MGTHVIHGELNCAEVAARLVRSGVSFKYVPVEAGGAFSFHAHDERIVQEIMRC